MRARALVALLLLGAALAPAIVAADPAAEARFFDERARRAYRRHRWDEALRFFLESHAAAPNDGTLYNIGVSAMLAGEPALAYSHLTEYVAAAPDGTRADDARRRLAELAPELALVRVESDPPGATITVDRDELGSWGTTPRTLVIDPGLRTLTLTLDGHDVAHVDVAAARGTTADVRIPLRALRGSLHLALAPPDAVAIVSRGGEEIARAVDGETLDLVVGTYDVRLEVPGHALAEASAVVRSEETLDVRLVAAPLPEITGRLLVDTGIVPARVIVDGIGRAATPAAIDVVAGSHSVRVEADGYNPWDGTLDIEAGRGRYLDLTLVPAD